MSSRNPPLKEYKFHNNTYSNLSSVSNKTIKTKFESVKKERFSVYSTIKPTDSSLLKENQDYYQFQYVFQDKADNTNTIFFDSNSRKFRTRFTAKSTNIKSNAINLNSISKFNLNQKRNQLYMLKNTNSDNNKYQWKSHNKSISNNIDMRKKKEISNKDSDIRKDVMKGMKNVIGDLIENNKNQNKDSDIRKNVINGMKDEIKKLIENNKNKNSEFRRKVIREMKNDIGNLIENKKDQNNFSQTKEDVMNKMKNVIDESLIQNKRNEKSKSLSKNNFSQKNNFPENSSKNEIFSKLKYLTNNNPSLNLNKIQNQNEIAFPFHNKNDISHKNEESKILSSKKNDNEENINIIQISQSKHEDKNKSNMDTNLIKNNVQEISQKTEEKTIALIPGQTIEKKTVNIYFENPTEEVVKNSDGTYSLILKQKKITTVTENSPIEAYKIKTVKGVPGLPIYKQLITYNYETISTSNKNDNIENNKLITFSQNNDNKNKAINRNLNKEENFKRIEDKLSGNNSINNEENKDLNKNSAPELYKSKEKDAVFEGKTKQKEIVETPGEKEKKINYIKVLFDNINKGKNSEDNLENISQFLSNLDEKERNEIMKQLIKDRINSNLIKQLESLMKKKISKNKDFESHKFSSNKDSFQKNKITGFKEHIYEGIEVKGISPLKYDGLFLEISQYKYVIKEKNPFDGPSPYNKFYKTRKNIIKRKINDMALGNIEDNKANDIKLV